MVKNILWDVDGTLFDTYPAMAKSFRAALNDLGADCDTGRIEALARESLSRCSAALASEFDIPEEALGRAFAAHYELVRYEDQPPFRSVREICGRICARGGKNVIVTHRSREGTAGLLAAHRMAELFSGCIAREDGYARKPDPASFLAALRLFELAPEETLAVGDREIDVEAGRAAGLAACRFAPGGESSAADLVIRGFDELLRFVSSR